MPSYTNEERFILLKKFYDMDINGDGSLSKEEIKKCCESSGLSPKMIQEFLSLFDQDGDDSVSLDEYERALGLKEIPKSSLEEWRTAFNDMDKDRSGKLNIDELYVGLRKAGCAMKKEDILTLVAAVDDDGDQNLSFNEFVAMMRL